MPLDKLFRAQWDIISKWLTDHALVAWGMLALIAALLVIVAIANTIAPLDILWCKVITPFLRWRAFRRLEKAAKTFDIRGHVNAAVSRMRKQLPPGWIRDIEIEWINSNSKEDFFRDEDVVVRMRPYEQQSRNFVAVTHQFFQKSFFPKVKKVIPSVQREAAVLYVCGVVAASRNRDAVDAFRDYIFEPSLDNDGKMIDYYRRYERLDECGLFCGPFLREIQAIAEEVRFTEFRRQMGVELRGALQHLEDFTAGYKTNALGDGDWIRDGVKSRYAILLVAHPAKAMHARPDQYLGRVRLYAESGVGRIYVLGAANERAFAKRVIDSLESQSDYTVRERFDLVRDYRGTKGGVGAILVRRFRQSRHSHPAGQDKLAN